MDPKSFVFVLIFYVWNIGKFPCRKFWCIWIVNKDKNFHNVPGLDVNLVLVTFMHFKFDFGEESYLLHSKLILDLISAAKKIFRVLLKLLNKILRIITLLSSSKLNTWHTNLKFLKIKATSSIIFLHHSSVGIHITYYILLLTDCNTFELLWSPPIF